MHQPSPHLSSAGFECIIQWISPKGPKQRTFFIIAVLWLVLGIGSSILVTVTGYQQLHVPTALGFVGLFFTELYFIIYAVPDSYNTGSNQASV